jgi:hypothetical protein
LGMNADGDLQTWGRHSPRVVHYLHIDIACRICTQLHGGVVVVDCNKLIIQVCELIIVSSDQQMTLLLMENTEDETPPIARTHMP